MLGELSKLIEERGGSVQFGGGKTRPDITIGDEILTCISASTMDLFCCDEYFNTKSIPIGMLSEHDARMLIDEII